MRAARQFGADAISHGATGKGNDQVRFELSVAALAPDLKVIAPWRLWALKGRSDLMDYARERGIAVPVTKEAPYSTDGNLLHVSYEGGVLEDPWVAPPQKMFRMTVDPTDAPDAVDEVTIGFSHGNPVSIDGQDLEPVALLEAANEIAGHNGVGRVDIVENRFVGIKSRGVYETPGGTLLHLCAPCRGVVDPRPRGHAPSRPVGPPVRRHGLQRVLVQPGAGRSPGLHGPDPGAGEWGSPHQPL